MSSTTNPRRIAALILEYTLIAAAIGIPAWGQCRRRTRARRTTVRVTLHRLSCA